MTHSLPFEIFPNSENWTMLHCLSVGKVWPAVLINAVIGGMIFEVSNQYIENKSSEFSTRVVSETTLEERLIGNEDFFCKKSRHFSEGFFFANFWCVPLIFVKNIFWWMDTILDCVDCHMENTLHSDFLVKFSVQFLRLPHSFT